MNRIAHAIDAGEIEWVHMRHEEAGAFAASAEALFTGELTACAGSCGPGSLHFINGLYEANRNRAPVILIATQVVRYLLIFPAIGAIASIGLRRSVQRRDDLGPFRFLALIFTAAFVTLACSFWPYMIPFALTVDQAASPPASLAFMFWGAGLFVMPLTLIYTLVVYRLFRGRVPEVGYE